MENSFLLRGGQVLQNGVFAPADVFVQDGKIGKITSPGGDADGLNAFDARDAFVLPGFIDIHTHGAQGVDVNAADEEGLGAISRFFAAHGVTGWLASILTDTLETTLHQIRAIRAYMEKPRTGARLLGIHLEGPFLNSAYKGAMPEHLLRHGDAGFFRACQKAAGDALRYITVAPEVPGVAELIPEMAAAGVRVAIGHSAATYDETMKAIEAGATACTHTFNGMRLFHQHEPAVMGAVLEDDRVYCEAICDGRHLHPGTVRLLAKTKGNCRILVVSDSIMATGLPDGHYKLGVNDVIVAGGDAMLADGGSRAGSTLTLDTAIANLIAFTGMDMAAASGVMSENPTRYLGLEAQTGSLAPGLDADFILMDGECRVRATFVGGHCVYQQGTRQGTA